MVIRLHRPSLVIAAWGAVLVGVFVVRGDLRVASAVRRGEPPVAVPATPTAPVVVTAGRSPRHALAEPRQRRGRVVDALGFLVVGAEVLAGERSLARTDADGAFAIEVADGGSLDVLVRGKGLQSRRLRIGSASPDPLVVQLLPGAPWDREPAALPATTALRGEGLVHDAQGAPLSGAWVTAIGSNTWSCTDDIGRYVLPLPSGAVTLAVHRADGGDVRGLAARSEPIDVGRTSGIAPLPGIVAAIAGAIRGVVRDSHGSPVEGVPLQASGEGVVRTCESGPGGFFRLGGLAAGRYVVRPFAYRGDVGRPHEVVLDHTAIVDCDLHLVPTGERRLRLLDERGAPVGRAWVVAAFAGERSSVSQTDATGWTAFVSCEDERVPDVAFEVRTGPEFEPLPVRRFEPESSTLVVGL